MVGTVTIRSDREMLTCGLSVALMGITVRQMSRRLITGMAALSVVALGLAGWLWVRSWTAAETFHYTAVTGSTLRWVELKWTQPGEVGIDIEATRQFGGSGAAPTFDGAVGFEHNRFEFDRDPFWPVDPDPVERSFRFGRLGGGWSVVADPPRNRVHYYQFVFLPTWALTVTLAAVPVVVVGRRLARRRARRPGRCRRCGYDLRATPERCPECGMAAGATDDRAG